MQVYKIFFENRVVILTGKVTKSFEKNDGLFYKFSNSHELRELLYAFEEFSHVPSLYILNKDTDAVMDEIKSFYTIVEAAGGLVKRPDDKFLGIYRNGVWDLPKGKVEKGEFYKQTALREVQEECGLKNIAVGKHMLDTFHTYKLKGDRILKRTIWYEMHLKLEETPVLQSEEGITDYKWFDSGNIGEALKNTYESLRDVYKHYIQVSS
ncbi:MAG TPA: NUDIX domain-containing protein [Bacteroidales bacterium]|nr:NUDIX domain-containing protein [Bacteroidales bacterium]